jgi:hypothetical protein
MDVAIFLYSALLGLQIGWLFYRVYKADMRVDELRQELDVLRRNNEEDHARLCNLMLNNDNQRTTFWSVPNYRGRGHDG